VAAELCPAHSWNQGTIVTIDHGVRDEDRGLHINFGHNV
jgi:hypothetical protein